MKSSGKLGKYVATILAALLVLAGAAVVAAPASAAAPSWVIEGEFDDSALSDTMTATLTDADTGEVLYAKDADRIIYPASTTKIMTALLSIELNGGSLDGTVVVAPEATAFSSSSSLLGLRSGAEASVRDLLYGLMLVSGNDAAVALAVHFGGSEAGFVQLMNQKAAALGMNDTHFANPHGLDQSNLGLDHHSTASDMTKLARAAYQNPVLMEIAGSRTYTVESTELNPYVRESPVLRNSNFLLATPEKEPGRARCAQFLYPSATGMKTGFLRNAGGFKTYGCLVASASRFGRNLIAAVFADTSDSPVSGTATDRWRAAISMFEYGFSGFVDVPAEPLLEDFSTSVQLSGYAENDPFGGILEVRSSPLASPPPTVRLDRRTAYDLQRGAIEASAEPSIAAVSPPVTQGAVVGSLSCRLEGEELFAVPLVAGRTVFAAGEEEIAIDYYGLPRPEPFPWALVVAAGAGAGAAALFFLILRRDGAGREAPREGEGGPSVWNDSALRAREKSLRDRLNKR